MSKQSLTEVNLDKQAMRDFRESLIRSSASEAFEQKRNQPVAQVIKGLGRTYFLFDTPEELEGLKLISLVEKVLMIPRTRLNDFFWICPECKRRLPNTGGMVTCTGCRTKFQTPGCSKS